MSMVRFRPLSPASSLSSWQGDFSQLRSLRYFRQCTSPQFSNFQLDKSFWEYVVPLLSYAIPMVRAAASALGAAHEICNTHVAPQTLSSELDHRRLHTFYMNQYGRALQQMQQHLDRQISGRAPVLVTCALLIYVELLQGNRVNALTHLQGGLSFLKGLIKKMPVVRQVGSKVSERRFIIPMKMIVTLSMAISSIFSVAWTFKLRPTSCSDRSLCQPMRA